jgi:CBS domain containing-hemolysin-like protein
MLLRAAQEEFDVTLEDISREILVVHETLPLPDLLERLLDRLEHIALVVDEYGGVAGVVTMEDVVETLLGLEIVDEADSVEDMQALARKQWFRRARELGMVSEEALETPPPADADELDELKQTILQQDLGEDDSTVAAEMSEMARRSSSESSTDE